MVGLSGLSGSASRTRDPVQIPHPRLTAALLSLVIVSLPACGDSDAELTRPTADRAMNALLESTEHSAADLSAIAAEYGEVLEASGDLYEGGAELVLRVTGEGEIGSGFGSRDGVVHHCYRLSLEVDLESETSADSIERTDCPS